MASVRFHRILRQEQLTLNFSARLALSNKCKEFSLSLGKAELLAQHRAARKQPFALPNGALAAFQIDARSAPVSVHRFLAAPNQHAHANEQKSHARHS